MNGIINVLKPTGMSSHDAVNFIRKCLNMKKVGHTGTLDPNAVGVLPICIGKGTKVIEYIQYTKKKYRAELTLGSNTDTQDKYGEIINTSDKKVSNETIIEVINSFKGDIKQIPPMYSALKKNGKRLYELAREGKTVERESRKVFIDEIDIIHINNNKVIFDVVCSKGTYIRTLCNDIGEKLGTYGHMSFLERFEVGSFKLDSAYTIEEIKSKSQINDFSFILPIDYPLINMKEIKVDKKFLKHLSNGLKISTRRLNIKHFDIDEEYRVYSESVFIGIGSIIKDNEDIFLKMNKVLV
ncbi:tRNA pseudouridine(55) synthase TruB [Clostridium sp. D2Q-11]|uniref:tRNA pseudouridine synthase B n=1 Tax=Anaeromonas frigoriresistens TaxID=2683708 RepID=A0A942UVB0_9FIRM|nr:tRNA pseudouridine(55) synthase TruB [Anaeromonas frigoriresistens]MBS4539894.1 tRNA pseudouridine(55) synthase TruB [Anaeromonas frigoriresistens]